MKVIYIADDDKEFDNELDCEHYEWMIKHKNLKQIKIYDKNGDTFDDILSEDAYNCAVKVIVPTDYAAEELRDWAEYSGYCDFEQITESGIWEFNNELESFVKVSEFQ